MSAPSAGRVPFEPHEITSVSDEEVLERAGDVVARNADPLAIGPTTAVSRAPESHEAVERLVERSFDRGAVSALSTDVEHIRLSLSRPAAMRSRRLLWMWFRVFVRTVKPGGKTETVNVRIPIPIPIIGALMPVRPSAERAANVAHSMGMAPDRETALAVLSEEVASSMAVEFVRVQESSPRKGREIVVVGLD